MYHDAVRDTAITRKGCDCMDSFKLFTDKYLFWLSIPQINLIDIIEIVILSFLMYQILLWVKNTRAWMLVKGIIVILAFMLVAYIFRMNTILWLANKTINVGIIAMVIIFQPELRRALEQLGRKNILGRVFNTETGRNSTERFSDKTINEIIRAVYQMGRVKTGALIVMEREVALGEYERTGITVDAVLSAQLLINIFEHNTPLHDGAILVRGDRVVSATCYLPLSDDMELSKELGTRHRAAIGVSEVTDSFTIVVSEETGSVSVAENGSLRRNVDEETLRTLLENVQNKQTEDSKRFRLWKGRHKHEEEMDV